MSNKWTVEPDRRAFDIGAVGSLLPSLNEWLGEIKAPLRIAHDLHDHIRIEVASSGSSEITTEDAEAAVINWVERQALVGKHSYSLTWWDNALEVRNRLAPLPAHGGYRVAPTGPDFTIIGNKEQEIGRIVRANRSWQGIDGLTTESGHSLDIVEAQSVEEAFLEVLHRGGWCLDDHGTSS